MVGLWRPLAALVLAGLLGWTAAAPARTAGADAAAEEFRAVWVDSVYNLDYPAKATTYPA